MSPLTKAYWKSAMSEFKSTKTIVLASVFIALYVALSSIFIQIPLPLGLGNQRVYFTFMVVSLGALIYGPIMGMAVGVVSDLLAFLIHPSGAFFIGYTITALVVGFTYGIFFYKTKISILKIIICKFCVNMFVNVPLNGLWDSILAGKGYLALVSVRIPKNLIMLPIEILLIYIVFSRLLPILSKQKIIKECPFENKIKWIK